MSFLLQKLRKMVDRIRKFQILNDQIFGIVEKYLRLSSDRATMGLDRVEIKHEDPPKKDPPPSQNNPDEFDDDEEAVMNLGDHMNKPGMRQSYA